MSISCDVILKWGATLEQLTVLGVALWRWCNRVAGPKGIYHYLDNQALADLIAGKLPTSSETAWPAQPGGVHFKFRDETSQDRQAAVDNLRREVPTKGVEDIVVDGQSWNQRDSGDQPEVIGGSEMDHPFLNQGPRGFR